MRMSAVPAAANCSAETAHSFAQRLKRSMEKGGVAARRSGKRAEAVKNGRDAGAVEECQGKGWAANCFPGREVLRAWYSRHVLPIHPTKATCQHLYMMHIGEYRLNEGRRAWELCDSVTNCIISVGEGGWRGQPVVDKDNGRDLYCLHRETLVPVGTGSGNDSRDREGKGGSRGRR